MAPPSPPWSAGPGVARAPESPVLWAGALAGCAAAAVSVQLALASDHVAEPGLQAALLDWITVPYILAGLVAWWRRPDSRFGPLMVAAGFVMFLSSLQWANAPAPFTLGLAFDLLPVVLFLHLFLAFPDGRLESRPERLVLAAGYAAAAGLQFVKMLLGAGGPDNVLAVVAQPAAANVVQDVQLISLAALALAGIVLLAVRRRRSGRPLRRSVSLLVDAFALGLVMIAALMLAGAFELAAFETIRRVTFGVIGVAPVAFLIGLMDARLARSGVADLVVELQADPPPTALRDALARALRDESLTLAYWLPEFESWVDLDGRPMVLPGSDSGVATTVIDRDGAPVAALLYHPSVDDEPELLEAVSAAAAMSLENGRLHAELKARLEELRGSRGRMIEAGQKERQRLERDLHDGAQQRLISLSLELRLLEERLGDDPDARAGLEQARREIALSLEELRAVARGIHPAVVSGHGLAVALESLAARAPVPVRLTVEVDGRVHERVEVAAYYVVCESLANIGKHAQATSATVNVARMNGDIVIEVVDDGIGGADSEGGTGLRGLADRVEALGGRLRVWTPRGGGTRVRAEMPCD
ncbi:MAG TPA: histidine kinase [Thermoleophilaceae bacterium]|nr:histidine kinase [Thermoleophilaceae bacterium]